VPVGVERDLERVRLHGVAMALEVPPNSGTSAGEKLELDYADACPIGFRRRRICRDPNEVVPGFDLTLSMLRNNSPYTLP
jgi:hypothetical protein